MSAYYIRQDISGEPKRKGKKPARETFGFFVYANPKTEFVAFCRTEGEARRMVDRLNNQKGGNR